MPQFNRAFVCLLVVAAGACLPDRTVGPPLAPTPEGQTITVHLRSDTAPSGMTGQFEIVPIPVTRAILLKGTHTRCGATNITRARQPRNVSGTEPPHSDPPQN